MREQKKIDLQYLSIFLIFISTLYACEQRTYNEKALQEIKVGMSYSLLVDSVGIPFTHKSLEEWNYTSKIKVFINNGRVFDFEIVPELLNKEKVLSEKHSDTLANRWAKLKIAFTAEELLALVGLPESKYKMDFYTYEDHQHIYSKDATITYIDLHAHVGMEKFDRIRLNFNAAGIHVINIALALIMFGIALELRVKHFWNVLTNPRSFLVGLLSQFVALPLLTFLLILVIKPTPSVAMGMILVAACPGGNISNFMSSLSGANTALSIGLTSFATIVTVFMTPFNFSLWGAAYAGASNAIVPISIDIWQMVQTVLLILGIPVVSGIAMSNWFPRISERLQKPIKIFGILFFIALVIGALSANFSFFIDYIHLIFILVLAHNLLALLTGFSLAYFFKLPIPDRRTLTIETGIQNSGLGLVLIFNPKLFDGLGGMAFIAAWWGIWHIVSGLTLALFWGRNKSQGQK